MPRSSKKSFDENGKGLAVQDRQLDEVVESERSLAPAQASAVKVRVEPPTKTVVPEADTEGKEEQSHSEEAAQSKPQRKKRRFLVYSGVGVAAVIAGILGVHWWQYASTHQSTDDAYVASNVHPVSSRINGTVTGVLVDDNQQVKAGQLLVTLDPRDYQVQVQQEQAALAAAQRQANAALANINLAAGNASGSTAQAQGNVAAAKAAISTAQAAVRAAAAGVPAAQAAVSQANANLQKAQADYQRYQKLYAEGVVAKQDLDTYRATYYADLAQKNSAVQGVAQAEANLAQAQENVTKAQGQLAASVGGLKQAQATTNQTQANKAQYQAAQAAIAQAQANLHNAQLQLSYTNIYSPATGRVGNKTVQVGQRVQPGTPLMAVVDNYNWVVANFKETQLAKMRRGQPAEISVDALGGHKFRGFVDSFAPGSGATFALLPPDNATGNFTKIVQRIPVKVLFDPNSIRGYESRISPGMSVEVSVDVSK